MRRGVRLGVDVGKARVGVARSDPDGLLAVPVETLPRAEALDKLVALSADYDALEIIVGLPISLRGTDTASTTDAREFAVQLAQEVSVPVRLVDERLSTVSAQQMLSGGGTEARKQRQIIDQASAVIILQHSLDQERRTGAAPGAQVNEGE
jgi:RNAse H-fold protein YqgF